MRRKRGRMKSSTSALSEASPCPRRWAPRRPEAAPARSREGLAITAASSTFGWAMMAVSRSTDDIHSPPLFTMSFTRSPIWMLPQRVQRRDIPAVVPAVNEGLFTARVVDSTRMRSRAPRKSSSPLSSPSHGEVRAILVHQPHLDAVHRGALLALLRQPRRSLIAKLRPGGFPSRLKETSGVASVMP